MVQVYLLVVAINILMGMIIIFEKINGQREDSSQGITFLSNNTFLLTLTIIACMVAFFCLITPYGQGGISKLPLIGDLFPTIITLAGSLVFLIRYVKQSYPEKIENNDFFVCIEANEYYIGITCVAIAIIHFLFPSIPLL